MGQGNPKTATRRQHTIPRMLLKRFASRVEGEEYYTWQFRRKAKPFETNIKNSSVESYFYGKATNGIEDSLSAVESRHAAALDEILHGEDPNEYKAELRELVWTLAIRTGNFRRNMGDLLVGGIDEIIDQAEDDTVRPMLYEHLEDELDDMLDKMVAKLPAVPARALRISLERRPALRGKFRRVVGIYFDSNDVASAFRTLLSAARSQMDFGKLTGDAHVRALGQLTESDCAPDSFRPEHWQLIQMPTRSVILGDGACFAIRDDDDPGHLLRFTRDWSEIYLPIAYDAVLVALRSNRPSRYAMDKINRASAALSYDQFFAAENGDQQRTLMDHIRSGTPALTPDEMRDAVRKAWLGSSAPHSEDDKPV